MHQDRIMTLPTEGGYTYKNRSISKRPGEQKLGKERWGKSINLYAFICLRNILTVEGRKYLQPAKKKKKKKCFFSFPSMWGNWCQLHLLWWSFSNIGVLTQSCPTFPTHGSSAHSISQARILEWVAISLRNIYIYIYICIYIYNLRYISIYIYLYIYLYIYKVYKLYTLNLHSVYIIYISIKWGHGRKK